VRLAQELPGPVARLGPAGGILVRSRPFCSGGWPLRSVQAWDVLAIRHRARVHGMLARALRAE
jgi:hypothetical protein